MLIVSAKNKEFLDQKAYRDKRGKLTSNIKKIFKKPVHGIPDLASGGFVGEVIIEENKMPDFIRKRALYSMSVSLARSSQSTE